MRRRKYLAAVGSLAAGGAAMMGTGAFQQSTAQRQFSLTIARDNEEPYLNLKPGNSTEYAEYAGGALEIGFGTNSQNGTGIPSRANTRFEDVFRIQNLGNDTVYAWAPSIPAGTPPSEAAGSASVQFLVPKSGVDGHKYGTGPVPVNSADISWPFQIDPDNKPSNPVPQIGSGGSGTGQVVTSYQGLRYPGGIYELGSGEEVSVDIRFTVSNIRTASDNLDEEFDSSFFVTADTQVPGDASAWDL